MTAGLLHRPRYVPAEVVDTIYNGRVRLSISADEFERLSEHEPPQSEQILPGFQRGAVIQEQFDCRDTRIERLLEEARS